jgi:hypothetical protein
MTRKTVFWLAMVVGALFAFRAYKLAQAPEPGVS